MLLFLLFISNKLVTWSFEKLLSSNQFLTVAVFKFMYGLLLFWRMWTEAVFYVGGFILKPWQEASCFIAASLTRMFSVPWGHSVFNGTQLTIYWTRYGRLTRAEIPPLHSSFIRNIFTKFFQINFSLLYVFLCQEITMQPPPRKVSFFPRWNLAAEANVTCLKRSRRTGAYLMVENVRFVAAQAMCWPLLLCKCVLVCCLTSLFWLSWFFR